MRKFTFHDVEQNTDEWFDMRGGLLTSSKLGVIMAGFGKAFGEPAKKYAVNIAVEQITGKAIASGYQNEHMQRGHDQEPLARELYEATTFQEVTNGGFFASDFIGCSPDGLVGEPGAIEIKSVIPTTHFANIKRGGLDPAYKWQCYGNLLFTGRDWLDFISYCQDFPEGKQLFTHRIRKEDCQKEFEQIEQRVLEFEVLVNQTKQTILESNYITEG